MTEKLAFLGMRVHIARKSCELTQQELADQAGLTVKTVLDIEKGRKNASYETLSQLIERLGVPANFFFPSTVSVEDADLQRFIGKFHACSPAHQELLLHMLDFLVEQLLRLQQESGMEDTD